MVVAELRLGRQVACTAGRPGARSEAMRDPAVRLSIDDTAFRSVLESAGV
jgi:hypothetical protein